MSAVPVVDLHAHSTASDGDLTPAQLVARAVSAGVTTLAITDHDTVAGWDEAVGAAGAAGLRLIPGIELTAQVPHGSMHLLGYFPKPSAPQIMKTLAAQSAKREARIRRIVERLGELGVPVAWESVRERAAGQLGRPHVAAAMVDAGHVTSMEEAFGRWLADDQPAHVPSEGLDPRGAVQLVRSAGGVPVLAHPYSLGLSAKHLEQFVQSLASAGLAGIEVHRPELRPEQRDLYAAIAKRLRLVPSGGSDFHRPNGPFALGDTGVPALAPETPDRLFDAIR